MRPAPSDCEVIIAPPVPKAAKSCIITLDIWSTLETADIAVPFSPTDCTMNESARPSDMVNADSITMGIISTASALFEKSVYLLLLRTTVLICPRPRHIHRHIYLSHCPLGRLRRAALPPLRRRGADPKPSSTCR